MAHSHSVRRRTVTASIALAVAAGLLGATGGAASAAERDAADVGITGSTTYRAFDDQRVGGGVKFFTAKCPPSHPWLQRFKPGSDTEINQHAPLRVNPGGVIVYEAGPVAISTYVDGSEGTSRVKMTGNGPSGYGEYVAYKGVRGDYAGWGGTAMEIVLACTDDPFNGGAVTPAGSKGRPTF